MTFTRRKGHTRKGRNVRPHPLRVRDAPPKYGQWTPSDLGKYLTAARKARSVAAYDSQMLYSSPQPEEVAEERNEEMSQAANIANADADADYDDQMVRKSERRAGA